MLSFTLGAAFASPRHSGRPANRNPSSTLFNLLFDAAVAIVGPKLLKDVFGQIFM